jgi:putative spermidine/putrescine transport system permease protein
MPGRVTHNRRRLRPLWSQRNNAAMTASRAPWLLVGLPILFLLAFFVAPNALLLTASAFKSDAQVLTNELTTENYVFIFGRALYRRAIYRTFWIGGSVGVLVVLLAYPVAFFLTRTASRWKGPLIALILAPLLASVVVRTYGWWVLLNRDGAVNGLLGAAGIVDQPLDMLPSSGAIIHGLTHALLPYGLLTIMAALSGLNPNVERAAMSLGAGRFRTFIEVTLPLSMTGILAAFLLAFSLAISAYATPAILGGPATETLATLIYKFMVSLVDWSIGSALGTVLIAVSLLLVWAGTVLGARRTA